MPPSAQSRICHHAKLGSSWFNAVLVVSNAVDIVTMLLLVLVVIVVFGILLQWCVKLRYAPFVKACLDMGLALKQRNII